MQGKSSKAVPYARIEFDGRGEIHDLNQEAEALLGARRSDAVGGPVANLIVSAHRDERLAALLSDSRADFLDSGLQLDLQRPDRPQFPAEIIACRTTEGAAKTTVFVRDLTREVHARLEAARREALMRRIEELSQIGSWEFRADTGELRLSPNLVGIYGLGPGPVTPEGVFEHIHPADRDRVVAASEAMLRGIPYRALRYRFDSPGRGLRHLQGDVTSVEGARDKPELACGTVLDLTDSLRTERELGAHVAVATALENWRSPKESAPELLRALADPLGFDFGVLWIPHEKVVEPFAIWNPMWIRFEGFERETRSLRLPAGAGAPGLAWERGEPVSIAGTPQRPRDFRLEAAERAGLRSGVVIPAVHAGQTMAILEFRSLDEVELDAQLMRSLTGIGYELGQFIDRRRAEFGPSRLTPRELEVLALAAHGYPGPKIAEALLVSSSTIKTHFEHIYAKLGVSDRAAAVATALREGVLD